MGEVLRNVGLSVIRDNGWVRLRTNDGRTYFANKTTGFAQWNIPTELYHSQRAKGGRGIRTDMIMPSEAKATVGTDCITHMRIRPLAGRMAQAVELVRLLGPRENAPETEKGPEIVPRTVLKVCVKSARGLRDADFMPGDDSDPFVECRIEGKDEGWTTPVHSNTNDPVWNFIGYLTTWSSGDTLKFCVNDQDGVKGNANVLQNSKAFYPGLHTVCDADSFDPLGDLTLKVGPETCDGKAREYRLSDDLKKPQDDHAYITLAFSLEVVDFVNGVPQIA